MTTLPPAMQVTLAVLVIAAAVYDLRSRRIPNWLTFPALPVGIVLSALLRGSGGLTGALLGAALAFATYFCLFALRAMGAGDVKLMTAVGAFTGPYNWLIVFVFAAIVGGLLALALLSTRGGLKNALANVLFVVGELVHFRAPYNARPGSMLPIPAPRASPTAFLSLAACSSS